ncbi:MAG: T9SS type A sorting domain-containing protein [Bacteroidota bacterium]
MISIQKYKVLIILFLLASSSISAQKRIPQNYQYIAVNRGEKILDVVTTIQQPNASSVRLYFEKVQMGERSYLLLEGIDGAMQKLDATALKNWHNSSAYFNGGEVKISVYQAPGDSVTFKVKDVKISERKPKQENSLVEEITTKSEMQSGDAEDIAFGEKPAYAAAVGRLTDGVTAQGTGWIAPNGAIITDYNGIIIHDKWVEGGQIMAYKTFDMIEFNVPLSDPDGTINHPSPEYQFPLNTENFITRLIQGKGNVDELPDAILIEAPVYNPDDGLFEDIVTVSTYSGYMIYEAIPNSSGKLPGEKIGEYFQVNTYPTGENIQGERFDLFHFGLHTSSQPDKNKTLQLLKVEAVNPNDVLHKVNDKDRFLTYEKAPPFPNSFWRTTMEGAPITYEGTNVALGIHSDGFFVAPSLGIGFRDNLLLDDLSDFFSSSMTYVDQASLWDTSNGEIDKPYKTVAEGIQAVPENKILSIAKGYYNEILILDKPITLQAPVGKAVIGASGGNSRIASTHLPAELFMDDEDNFTDWEDKVSHIIELQAHPNPFTDATELQYTLYEALPVTVKVFDILGNEINTLLEEEQAAGKYTLTFEGKDKMGIPIQSGLYIIKMQIGTQISTVKVIKE